MSTLVDEAVGQRIDKNVPLPETRKGPQGLAAVFIRLEVGDSFLSPPTVNRGNLSATVSYWNKKLGRKHATRIRYQERDGECGYRVWRIE